MEFDSLCRATSSDKYHVAKVAAFILAQFAQQLAQLGRGVVALGFLGGELWILPPSRSPARPGKTGG